MHKGNYDNQKKLLRFSKNQIKKAAKDIRKAISGEDRDLAIEKIQNFREFHLYPLMLMKNHLARTSKKVNKSIIVARRLKRLPTIIDKLERDTLDGGTQNSIELTRMQDIAGCRAIVNNSKELHSLHQRLIESRSVHKIVRQNNYLIPKSSGYGGIHLIYSCYENQKSEHIWKKTKVEVQLRTKLQHAWATSLEIIDTLEHTNLKTSYCGSLAWRRYFFLMGRLVSHEEGFHKLSQQDLFETRCQLFGSPGLFYPKLQGLAAHLGVISKLRKYALAINLSTDKKILATTKNSSGLFLILMTLNEKKGNQSIDVSTTFFPASDSDDAIKKYNEAEMNPTIYLTVLLSVTDAKTLKQAYPNYFGSTTSFTKFSAKHNQEHHDYLLKKINFFQLKHDLIKKLKKRTTRLNRNKLIKLQILVSRLYSGLYEE
jgi:ppGpp synthetase/RelA/SpoT-type nucleotidyltranferase